MCRTIEKQQVWIEVVKKPEKENSTLGCAKDNENKCTFRLIQIKKMSVILKTEGVFSLPKGRLAPTERVRALSIKGL